MRELASLLHLGRDRSREAWFRPSPLSKIYSKVRDHFGGPPLQISRTLGEQESIPVEAGPLVARLLERALRRLRTGGGSGPAAVAIRIELETRARDGVEELVIRVFDNGPVFDPPDLPELDLAALPEATFRREPPAGPWAGVGVLRIPLA